MQALFSPPPAPLLPFEEPHADGSRQVTADAAAAIGRFVRVDLRWSAHPFAASGLGVADEPQPAAVRSPEAGRASRRLLDDGDGRAAAAAAAPPLSRHAPRVLAALEQLWRGAAAAGGRTTVLPLAPHDGASTAAADPFAFHSVPADAASPSPRPAWPQHA